MTIIFTDGAARGNPGPGGWGAIVATDNMVTELGGGEDYTTNNQMELLAVISALESVPNEHEITFYTDSAYVINGITRWIHGWQKNNWKTSQKEEVLNRDLWEKMVKAVAHRIINWKLLKGHSGIPANERCDTIATSFADKQPIGLYQGSLSRYGVSLLVSNYQNNLPKTKTSTRRKVHSYVSEVGGIILTHKTWEECKARVHSTPNARFKKSTSPFDEEEIIKEFS